MEISMFIFENKYHACFKLIEKKVDNDYDDDDDDNNNNNNNINKNNNRCTQNKSRLAGFRSVY
jgi:hypothetical protein